MRKEHDPPKYMWYAHLDMSCRTMLPPSHTPYPIKICKGHVAFMVHATCVSPNNSWSQKQSKCSGNKGISFFNRTTSANSFFHSISILIVINCCISLFPLSGDHHIIWQLSRCHLLVRIKESCCDQLIHTFVHCLGALDLLCSESFLHKVLVCAIPPIASLSPSLYVCIP